MLKKTITYTDFNGNERTETHYFHLTQAEALELEMSASGGLSEHVRRIVEAQDTPTLIKLWKEIIKMAYGVKSPDGKKFEKSEELFKEFAQTNAYSKLFMELSTNADEAAKFVNGIMDIVEPNGTKAITTTN